MSPRGSPSDGAGNVYVVDRENNRVQEFDSEGRFLAKWGTRGVGPGEFSQPSAIAVDCNGDVYVADTNNNRVERFNPVIPAVDRLPGAGSVATPAGRGADGQRERCHSPPACWPGVRSPWPSAAGVPARSWSPPRSRRWAGRVDRRAACRWSRPRVRCAPGRPRRCACAWAPLALARLRRALGNHDVMKARVSIIAAGPTGRRTSITKTYRGQPLSEPPARPPATGPIMSA